MFGYVTGNVTELKVNVSQIQAAVVILSWDPFVLNDHRSLLGYVVHSIEAPYRNVTLYDGRDGCGGDGYVYILFLSLIHNVLILTMYNHI